MTEVNLGINSFRDLKVWQNGLIIAHEIYLLTKKLPREEVFGLSSQMRRAAVSVPSNIAEGRSRGSRKDFSQFLHIAIGSLSELETQLLLLEMIYPEIKVGDIMKMINEEQKMLAGLLRSMKNPVSPKTQIPASP
ncbi:MAG: S23 ribosomal protein [Parcubacteria group bacterium GW2011_GWA1_47_8]|nr:MAG: S23 ribosomal protein [Parcubacteria group bacterium GW2011_GWA1_47_8]KKW07565.1 MAG: S23 ribosomal protein [Parcubacteria group bacterium GW2011_GWA2_49_16]